ncbi:MAG: hypothetical protein ACYDA6_03570, partial [Solirubrobacteraceae bacterium]
QAVRTIVKSPPELWSELSDPAALARHLSELGPIGEIKITRVEPEHKVEWQAPGASGAVELKPSGWGTKVTLSLSHGPAEGEQDAVGAEAADDDGAPAAEPAEAAVKPAEASARAVAHGASMPGSAEEPATPAIEVWPLSEQELARTKRLRARVKTFAKRLARRVRGGSVQQIAPAGSDAAELDAIAEQLLGASAVLASRREAPVPVPVATAANDPSHQAADAAAEEPRDQDAPSAPAGAPRDEEPDRERDAEPDTEPDRERSAELLNAVLDRLGEAHHRPFSRS